MSDETAPAIRKWCTAGERGDAEAAVACASPDVVLISPLTDQFRFTGRDALCGLLDSAFTVIQDICFHDVVGGGDTYALFYSASVGSRDLEEAQLIRLDAGGLINEVTLFIRPLPALTALMAGLGPALARHDRRPTLARFLSAATAPLAAMTRFGDKRIVPLAAPGHPAPGHRTDKSE